MFVSPTRVCVVYVVKEVTSFPGGGGLGQLMGVARKRTRDQLQQKESCVQSNRNRNILFATEVGVYFVIL